MIVRDQGESWQIVLQTDHADLAGALSEAWADRGARHESLVVAARRHDDGWAVWERSPLVDGGGAPVAFLDVHVPAHLAFYRAGIAAITDEDPYAGLLVSMHGAGIYRQRYGTDTGLSLSRAAEVQPLVDAFVEEQESGYAARMRLRASTTSTAGRTTTGCSGTTVSRSRFACVSGISPDGASFELGEFRFSPLGPWRAQVAPYPFAGQPSRFGLCAGSCPSAAGRRRSSVGPSSTPSPRRSRSSSAPDPRRRDGGGESGDDPTARTGEPYAVSSLSGNP